MYAAVYLRAYNTYINIFVRRAASPVTALSPLRVQVLVPAAKSNRVKLLRGQCTAFGYDVIVRLYNMYYLYTSPVRDRARLPSLSRAVNRGEIKQTNDYCSYREFLLRSRARAYNGNNL